MRHVILIPDLESGGYTVEVPSFPGCISEGDYGRGSARQHQRGDLRLRGNAYELGREVPKEQADMVTLQIQPQNRPDYD